MSALQQQFAQDCARLIQQAATLGYGVTLGEAWRTPEQAAWNAEYGKGIAHSLHMQRLAIDLNLFKGDDWLTDDASGAYGQLGEWWKSQSPMHFWGGDFQLKDYCHFSISPDNGATK